MRVSILMVIAFMLTAVIPNDVTAQHYGACCFVSFCIESEQDECELAGGEWQGPNDCSFAQCPAACVEQTPIGEYGFFSDLDRGMDNGIQIIAENFELYDPIEIDRIVFFGGYFTDPEPQGPDRFEIVLRERTDNVPGDEISRVMGNSPSRVPLFLNVPYLLYCVNLSDQRIALEPGDYFIEIYNDTEGDPDTWFWLSGTVDPDHGLLGYARSWTFPEEPWTFDVEGELAFIFGGDCNALGIEDDLPLPSSFVLQQNYPNPFNATTRIDFMLSESGQVNLAVYDLLGNKAGTLLDEFVQAGDHSITFDASHLASGVYFYRLRAGDRIETRRMALIK